MQVMTDVYGRQLFPGATDKWDSYKAGANISRGPR